MAISLSVIACPAINGLIVGIVFIREIS